MNVSILNILRNFALKNAYLPHLAKGSPIYLTMESKSYFWFILLCNGEPIKIFRKHCDRTWVKGFGMLYQKMLETQHIFLSIFVFWCLPVASPCCSLPMSPPPVQIH